MTQSAKNEIFKRAREHYGIKYQLIVAIEELAELQKELTKYMRYKGKTENIAEEIADVEICLEELKYFFDLNAVVSAWKSKKLRRLQSRIEYNTPANDEGLQELQNKFNVKE